MKKCISCLAALLLLTGVAAHAQTERPVLGAPPVAPPPAPATPEVAPEPAPTAPATAAPAQAAPPPVAPPDSYLLGRSYHIETNQGTSFTGMLVSMSLTNLEFDAQELGHISLQRSQVRRATLVGPVTLGRSSNYYDIGNGNRIFFAPTGRGLRKGEGTVQDVDVYLVGVNYGITDNISVGGYMSVVPGLSLDQQFLALTPKLSYPVGDKLHAGFGLLYVRVPTFDSDDSGLGVGIAYGTVTYGSADNNVTAGLGYGFVQGDIGSTPILQIGGQKRVSRRISLLSENYIVANRNAGLAGLYGIKLNWRRTSLGLGALYFYAFGHNEEQTIYNYNYNTNTYTTTTQKVYVPGSGFSTYIVPVYIDFTFRFGKGVGK